MGAQCQAVQNHKGHGLTEEQREGSKPHCAGAHLEVSTKQAPQRTGGADGREHPVHPGGCSRK